MISISPAIRQFLLPMLMASSLIGSIATARAADHATILMYHRFGEDKYPTTNVRIEQFEEHLEILASGKYSVWPLQEIISNLQAGKSVPDRTVAITIDDAYLSVYEVAMPRLKERGFHATLFVATRPIDRDLRNYMDWAQLREWQAAGFGIGSQTRTHPCLLYTSPSPRDVEESRMPSSA